MKITRDTQTMARRLLKWCMPAGMLDEDRVRRVSALMSAGRLRNRLPLLVAFTRLVGIQIARRTATIRSAVGLTDAEKAAIAARLEARYGAGLIYSWQTDPSLIAGIRVRVSDDVTDGSVRARIARLEQIGQH